MMSKTLTGNLRHRWGTELLDTFIPLGDGRARISKRVKVLQQEWSVCTKEPVLPTQFFLTYPQTDNGVPGEYKLVWEDVPTVEEEQ